MIKVVLTLVFRNHTSCVAKLMLYVIRLRLFNKAKVISGGQSFKSCTKFTYYGIVFTLNISMEVILSAYLIMVSF